MTIYIIVYTYDYGRFDIHMVTPDKAKAEREMARLDNFDYELREEFMEIA